MTTTWKQNEYQDWVDNGCPLNAVITKLDLADCQLSSISPKIAQLTNLTSLYLNHNQLISIPPEIGNLSRLTNLYLHANRLTSIPPEIGNLTNLGELHLDNNQLASIPLEIGNLKNLRSLAVGHNQLTAFPPEIGNLTNLTSLYLNHNRLTSIPLEIGNLTRLVRLSITHNQLTFLPSEFGNLTNLTTFSVSYNQLTALPPEFGDLTNLHIFFLDNNPIENIPLNVARLLNRQKTIRGVYGDTQSVHNSSIQTTLKNSIMRLLKEPIPQKEVMDLVVDDSTLTPFTKESLVEYAKDESVHTQLNLTFSDLLILVWNRIMMSRHMEEIKGVLNTEMRDAECKCFTGRISRLVNCLSGFDPLVTIQISDNEQIGTIISLVKTQLEEKGEYTTEKHKSLARERLVELGVKNEEIDVWLEHIE